MSEQDSSPPHISTRPYMIRALYEWCTDNGFTPYLSVTVDATVDVPREYVKEGHIVLNISKKATGSLVVSNEAISFKARFGGVARDILIPINCVQSIFARENGLGMAFQKLDSQMLLDDPLDKDRPPMGMPASGLKSYGHDREPPPKKPRPAFRIVSSSEGGKTPSTALAPVSSHTPAGPGEEPPKPPNNPRPTLKRVK